MLELAKERGIQVEDDPKLEGSYSIGDKILIGTRHTGSSPMLAHELGHAIGEQDSPIMRGWVRPYSSAATFGGALLTPLFAKKTTPKHFLASAGLAGLSGAIDLYEEYLATEKAKELLGVDATPEELKEGFKRHLKFKAGLTGIPLALGAGLALKPVLSKFLKK